MCLQLHWGGLKLWTMTVISKSLQQCLIILKGLENHHFASLILLGNFFSNNFLNYLLKYLFLKSQLTIHFILILLSSKHLNMKTENAICQLRIFKGNLWRMKNVISKWTFFSKKELLKLVFSEIRVRRLVQVVFQQKKMPLIDWPGRHLNSFLDSDSRKKLTLGIKDQ